jgi:hypothetical protein
MGNFSRCDQLLEEAVALDREMGVYPMDGGPVDLSMIR